MNVLFDLCEEYICVSRRVLNAAHSSILLYFVTKSFISLYLLYPQYCDFDNIDTRIHHPIYIVLLPIQDCNSRITKFLLYIQLLVRANVQYNIVAVNVRCINDCRMIYHVELVWIAKNTKKKHDSNTKMLIHFQMILP